MACWYVHVATRSSSICTIMDEASRVDDDDDSIAGRWVGNVDDSERALVRDLLVPLIMMLILDDCWWWCWWSISLHRCVSRLVHVVSTIVLAIHFVDHEFLLHTIRKIESAIGSCDDRMMLVGAGVCVCVFWIDGMWMIAIILQAHVCWGWDHIRWYRGRGKQAGRQAVPELLERRASGARLSAGRDDVAQWLVLRSLSQAIGGLVSSVSRSRSHQLRHLGLRSCQGLCDRVVLLEARSV